MFISTSAKLVIASSLVFAPCVFGRNRLHKNVVESNNDSESNRLREHSSLYHDNTVKKLGAPFEAWCWEDEDCKVTKNEICFRGSCQKPSCANEAVSCDEGGYCDPKSEKCKKIKLPGKHCEENYECAGPCVAERKARKASKSSKSSEESSDHVPKTVCGCVYEEDCDDGEVCLFQTGYCEVKSCRNGNPQCDSGEFCDDTTLPPSCVERKSLNAPCSDNTQCATLNCLQTTLLAPGRTCVCSLDSDCPESKDLGCLPDEGLCVPKTCATGYVLCSPDQYCDGSEPSKSFCAPLLPFGGACSSAEICASNFCRGGVSGCGCSGADECNDSNSCNGFNGACEQPSCATGDINCEESQYCNPDARECRSKLGSAEPCRNGGECASGRCLPGLNSDPSTPSLECGCAQTSDCPPTLECGVDDGLCQDPSCRTGGDLTCPVGEYCDGGSGPSSPHQCVPRFESKSSCEFSDQCLSGVCLLPKQGDDSQLGECRCLSDEECNSASGPGSGKSKKGKSASRLGSGSGSGKSKKGEVCFRDKCQPRSCLTGPELCPPERQYCHPTLASCVDLVRTGDRCNDPIQCATGICPPETSICSESQSEPVPFCEDGVHVRGDFAGKDGDNVDGKDDIVVLGCSPAGASIANSNGDGSFGSKALHFAPAARAMHGFSRERGVLAFQCNGQGGGGNEPAAICLADGDAHTRGRVAIGRIFGSEIVSIELRDLPSQVAAAMRYDPDAVVLTGPFDAADGVGLLVYSSAKLWWTPVLDGNREALSSVEVDAHESARSAFAAGQAYEGCDDINGGRSIVLRIGDDFVYATLSAGNLTVPDGGPPITLSEDLLNVADAGGSVLTFGDFDGDGFCDLSAITGSTFSVAFGEVAFRVRRGMEAPMAREVIIENCCQGDCQSKDGCSLDQFMAGGTAVVPLVAGLSEADGLALISPSIGGFTLIEVDTSTAGNGTSSSNVRMSETVWCGQCLGTNAVCAPSIEGQVGTCVEREPCGPGQGRFPKLDDNDARTAIETCRNCSAGFISRDLSDTCEPCPRGFFSGEEGASSCRPCPDGFYQDERAKSECKACPGGTYAADRISCQEPTFNESLLSERQPDLYRELDTLQILGVELSSFATTVNANFGPLEREFQKLQTVATDFDTAFDIYKTILGLAEFLDTTAGLIPIKAVQTVTSTLETVLKAPEQVLKKIDGILKTANTAVLENRIVSSLGAIITILTDKPDVLTTFQGKIVPFCNVLTQAHNCLQDVANITASPDVQLARRNLEGAIQILTDVIKTFNQSIRTMLDTSKNLLDYLDLQLPGGANVFETWKGVIKTVEDVLTPLKPGVQAINLALNTPFELPLTETVVSAPTKDLTCPSGYNTKPIFNLAGLAVCTISSCPQGYDNFGPLLCAEKCPENEFYTRQDDSNCRKKKSPIAPGKVCCPGYQQAGLVCVTGCPCDKSCPGGYSEVEVNTVRVCGKTPNCLALCCDGGGCCLDPNKEKKSCLLSLKHSNCKKSSHLCSENCNESGEVPLNGVCTRTKGFECCPGGYISANVLGLDQCLLPCPPGFEEFGVLGAGVLCIRPTISKVSLDFSCPGNSETMDSIINGIATGTTELVEGGNPKELLKQLASLADNLKATLEKIRDEVLCYENCPAGFSRVLLVTPFCTNNKRIKLTPQQILNVVKEFTQILDKLPIPSVDIQAIVNAFQEIFKDLLGGLGVPIPSIPTKIELKLDTFNVTQAVQDALNVFDSQFTKLESFVETFVDDFPVALSSVPCDLGPVFEENLRSIVDVDILDPSAVVNAGSAGVGDIFKGAFESLFVDGLLDLLAKKLGPRQRPTPSSARSLQQANTDVALLLRAEQRAGRKVIKRRFRFDTSVPKYWVDWTLLSSISQVTASHFTSTLLVGNSKTGQTCVWRNRDGRAVKLRTGLSVIGRDEYAIALSSPFPAHPLTRPYRGPEDANPEDIDLEVAAVSLDAAAVGSLSDGDGCPCWEFGAKCWTRSASPSSLSKFKIKVGVLDVTAVEYVIYGHGEADGRDLTLKPGTKVTLDKIQYASIPGVQGYSQDGIESGGGLRHVSELSFDKLWEIMSQTAIAEHFPQPGGSFSVDISERLFAQILANIVQGGVFDLPWPASYHADDLRIVFNDDDPGRGDSFGVYRRVLGKNDRLLELSSVSRILGLPNDCFDLAAFKDGGVDYDCRLSKLIDLINADFVDITGPGKYLQTVYKDSSVATLNSFKLYILSCRCFAPETRCTVVKNLHEKLWRDPLKRTYEQLFDEFRGDDSFDYGDMIHASKNRFRDFDNFYFELYVDSRKESLDTGPMLAPRCCRGFRGAANSYEKRELLGRGVSADEVDPVFIFSQNELENRFIKEEYEAILDEYLNSNDEDEREALAADWKEIRIEQLRHGDRYVYCQDPPDDEFDQPAQDTCY